jgi:hypothetical protein
VGGAKVVDFVKHERKEVERPRIKWEAESRRMYDSQHAQKTRRELSQQLGVTERSLELLGVGWGADREEFASFPMKGIRGLCVGIVRRYADGTKKSMQHSRLGLFYGSNWLQYRGPVLIPEGASDVAALLSMGLCAVGRPSNQGGVLHLATMLAGVKRPFIVLAEQDEKPSRRGERPWCPVDCAGCGLCWPGKAGAMKTAQELGESFRKRVMFRFPPDGAKDVRAWVQTHGLDGQRFLAGLRSP